MSGSSTTRRGAGFPWGLLGAALLVLSIERSVGRHGIDLSDITTLNWGYSSRATRAIAPRKDVLCFGTSLVKFGVMPKAIESATGLSAFNLAVCNSHMPTSYYLFKRTLDAGARPVAVLLDFQDSPIDAKAAGDQAETFRVNARNWPELLLLPECLDLAWAARDGAFLAATAVSRVLPSYKDRFEIRKRVVEGFEGREATDGTTNRVFLRNWNANLGANVMPPGSDAPPAPVPPLAGSVADHFGNGDWVRNGLSETYLRRFLELAKAHEIPVFWLIPPLPPAAVVERHNQGIDRYFDSIARLAREIDPAVTVIDASRSGYPAGLFHDSTHVNAKGAVALSRGVADVIARTHADPRGSSRWVSLPAATVEVSPPAWPVEDIASSQAIVRGDGGQSSVRR